MEKKETRNLPKMVIKRTGSRTEFDVARIKNSIWKAMLAQNKADEKLLNKVVNDALNLIEKQLKDKEPNVEEIQDIIEISLMRNNLFDVAKAFILYRKKKADIRNEKRLVLNVKELDDIEKSFSLSALRVLASRYLIKNENNEIVERPRELFERVSIVSILGELVFDEKVYSKEPSETNSKDDVKRIDELIASSEDFDSRYSIGKYKINRYMFEQLLELFKEQKEEGHIKLSVDDFLKLIEDGYFNKYGSMIDEAFELLSKKCFMPNTPALINGGRRLGMLSACFTLNVEDDMESIMELCHDVAIIQKCGGGTGINFSKLRPKDDVVDSTKGVSSGPISFMKLVDAVSDVIKQGGVRRGANMGILEDWHPDIIDFVKAKEKDGMLSNFNISAGIWEYFWNSLYEGKKYPLKNPRTGEEVKKQDARELFDLISYYAWSIADPGVLFFDNINKRNVLEPAIGEKIRVTNPCGEEPLYPNESCNLASINLSKFVEDGKFNWDEFHSIVRKVTRYLNNMMEINRYPLEKIKKATKLTRRIGVGMMGLAEALFMMKVKYNSEEGFKFMRKVSEHLTYYAYFESMKIAEERGAFPLFKKSNYTKGDLPIEGFYQKELWTLNWEDLAKQISQKGVRNAMVSTSPPTGSVSMIADTTSGIEPIFAIVFEKNVTVGNFFYVDPVFEEELKLRGLHSEEMLKKISTNGGSLQGIDELPDDLKEIYVTAMDLHWLDHLVAQAEMQRWITDSISKTINMKKDSSVDDIKNAYLIAHELNCKGVTVYRDGSKYGQVLNVDSSKEGNKIIKPSNYSKALLKKLYESNLRFATLLDIQKILESEGLNKSLGSFVNNESKEKQENEGKQQARQTKESKQTDKIKDDEERCPLCGSKLTSESGCKVCHNCGWSACTVG